MVVVSGVESALGPSGAMRACTAETATAVIGSCCLCIGTTLMAALVALVLGCSSDPPSFFGLSSASAGGSEGARCVSGFSESGISMPCAHGLTCIVRPHMPCAGTCYGTCSAAAAAATTSEALGPCGGYAAGQACITAQNLARCHELVEGGCAETDLVAMESCPLQFGCSSRPAQRQDCGPVGECGLNAECVGACDAPPGVACASVRCVCSPGFQGDGYHCWVPPSVAAVESAPTAVSAPASMTTATYSDHSSDSGGLGEAICDGERENGHVITELVGIAAALFLLSATPLLSCQSEGCAGCKGRGGSQAQLSWGVFSAAMGLCLVCGEWMRQRVFFALDMTAEPPLTKPSARSQRCVVSASE